MSPTPPPMAAVYGRRGSAVLASAVTGADPFARMLAEFAETVGQGGGQGGGHPLDAAHGLRIQEIIASVEKQLAGDAAVPGGRLRP